MTAPDLERVPGRSHYSLKYMRGGRIFSYAHQINAVLGFEPETVLEVGPGPGMVTAALRAIGIRVTTVDVQPDLKPDVVASVTDLPLEDGSFDVSMCCQVLEHLPFAEFVPALRELRRVSKEGVVISLPDIRPHYSLAWQLPILRRGSLVGTRRRSPSAQIIQSAWVKSGHYWEVGYPEVSLCRLHAAINEAGLSIERDWRVSELPWHHFYRLSR